MTQFEVVQSGLASVTLRHVDEGHEFEFGFVGPDGSAWQDPHLICHTEGGGSTGTGLAGEHLEQARRFAASVHAGIAEG